MTGVEPGTLDTAHSALPYVRRGPAEGAQVLIVQPLFEERNRLRRLLTAVMRGLAARGLGSWMFDLPATGESALPSAAATWPAWEGAVRAAAEHVAARAKGRLHVLSVRGGALLDAIPARSLYRLAPVAGERLLRDLLRTRLASSDGETMAALDARIAGGETLDLAGYPVPAALAEALRGAVPGDPAAPLRVATIGDGTADINFDAPRLWRQAEPDANPALGEALTADFADWIERCGR